MSFLVLPPETNSLRMFSGAGPAPMLSAAAESFSSVTSGLAGQAWQGPASATPAIRTRPSTAPASSSPVS